MISLIITVCFVVSTIIQIEQWNRSRKNNRNIEVESWKRAQQRPKDPYEEWNRRCREYSDRG